MILSSIQFYRFHIIREKKVTLSEYRNMIIFRLFSILFDVFDRANHIFGLVIFLFQRRKVSKMVNERIPDETDVKCVAICGL